MKNLVIDDQEVTLASGEEYVVVAPACYYITPKSFQNLHMAYIYMGRLAVAGYKNMKLFDKDGNVVGRF